MGRVLLVVFLCWVAADIASHLVSALPGVPYQPFFKIYSGFFNVTSGNGKQIHYMFIESQSNPISDPVVLWLNGGPGCSSMEGLFYENGPFVFEEGSQVLIANNYSWNLNASMLYFEAPAGTGLSFLGDLSNNNTGDNQTAADNLDVLVQFFEAYSEYSSREFFIAGESYSGIYIPTLAYNILQNNLNSTTPINLKGYLLGNAVTDWNYDVSSAVPYFAYWHGIINETLYNSWVSQGCQAYNLTPECAATQSSIGQSMNNVNPYDIYRPCDYTPNNFSMKVSRVGATPYLDCNDDAGLYAYMNNQTVREALNCGNVTWEWELCHHLNYTINRTAGSIYLYPELLTQGLRVWYYSGDTDSVVATIGTLGWINELGLNTTEPWRQWSLNGQVAGYTQDFTGLKFLTIKGTGHMAIQWKRPEGAYIFWEFLQGGSLD